MPITHAFVSAAPPPADPTKVGSAEWNAQHVVNIQNADVDPAAAIAESKLNLNFPTHAALTLGVPANGLSLAGQVLSLGLAASGVTGALSGADWDTFNNKQAALGYTPLNPANNLSDVANAATALANLGGQASLTFPLAANLGGTGIVNAVGSTLTLGAATSITGGGTLALGGFTGTLPATGTFALLATANIFTVPQTIDLAADGIGLTVQGAAGQTSNLFVLEASGGTDLFSVGPTGIITQAATSTTTGNPLTTTVTWSANPSGTRVGYDLTFGITNTVQITRTIMGIRFFSKITDDANTGWAGGSCFLIGGQFRAGIESTSSISVPTVIGGDFFTYSLSNRASWIATNAIGGRFNIDLQSNATHTTANAYSLYVTSHVKNANITLTNGYGLYIEDINVAGTLNYAVYTNAGLVHFGDDVDLASGQNLTLVAGNIITDTTTGTKIGTATGQKLGFWNVTPVIQPAGATQAAPAAYVTGAFGLDSDAHMQALYDLVVAMRTALVNTGIMKGAA